MSKIIKNNLKFICEKNFTYLKLCNFANKSSQKMLEHLVSASRDHSISKAIATIFIAQPILKPSIIFERLTGKVDFQMYQRKSLSHLKTIDVDIENNTIHDNRHNIVNGFTFESFDERGRLKSIFRLVNGDGTNKTTLSFETRMYNRWDSFVKDFKKDFSSFSEEYPFFIEAISLTYVDEFDWKSEQPIPINEILEVQSGFVNNHFLSSDNGSIVYITQNEEELIVSEERVEVAFSNTVKKIIINHQYARQFRNLEISKDFLDNDAFLQNFEEAHNANKAFLRTLLTKPIKDLIKLN